MRKNFCKVIVICLTLCCVIQLASCNNVKSSQTEITKSDSTAKSAAAKTEPTSPEPKEVFTSNQADALTLDILEYIKSLDGVSDMIANEEFVLSNKSDTQESFKRLYKNESQTVTAEFELASDGRITQINCGSFEYEKLFEYNCAEPVIKYICERLGINRDASICDHQNLYCRDYAAVYSKDDDISLVVNVSSVGLYVGSFPYKERENAVSFINDMLFQKCVSDDFVPMAQFQSESFRFSEEKAYERIPNELEKLKDAGVFVIDTTGDTNIEKLGGYITMVYRTDDRPREDQYSGEYCANVNGDIFVRVNADTGKISYIAYHSDTQFEMSELTELLKSYSDYLGMSMKGHTREITAPNYKSYSRELKSILRETVIISCDKDGNVFLKWINTNWVEKEPD